jgi:ribosomal protein S18 acetylase RimI-like enzyme
MDEEDKLEPDPLIPPDRLRYWQPLKELRAPGSFYVCSLAVLPDFRGRGIGTRLLSIADSRARRAGIGKLSLHVFEGNTEAVRLYERNGLNVVDRRPVVPHPLIRYTGDFLLMVGEL